MSIERTHAVPIGFYTAKDRGLWEIEVDFSLRELHVIAAGPKAKDDVLAEATHIKAPGIRIRDMYCGEWEMAEEQAIPLTPTEARNLAIALLAAAEEYERYLDPVGHDGDHLCLTGPPRR